MEGRATILMYHSISIDDTAFSVSPRKFGAQMRFLSESKYKVIPLSELVQRLENNVRLKGEIVITFDDGYKDNFLNAYPILKQYNFPATIFMTTDLVGHFDNRNIEMLTEEDIKEMHRSGFIDIEPHSCSHPKLARCSKEDVFLEVGNSKGVIERLLDKTCSFFAYPYGSFNDDTVNVLRSLGFTCAVTVEEGSIDEGENLFKLKRVSIDRSTSLIQFRGKISRAIDYYKRLKL